MGIEFTYYKLTNGDVIDQYDVARVMYFVTGKQIPYTTINLNMASIDAFASICSGIVGKIENPDVVDLIESGHKISAIKVYHLMNNVSFKEAREYIDKLEKDIKEGNYGEEESDQADDEEESDQASGEDIGQVFD